MSKITDVKYIQFCPFEDDYVAALSAEAASMNCYLFVPSSSQYRGVDVIVLLPGMRTLIAIKVTIQKSQIKAKVSKTLNFFTQKASIWTSPIHGTALMRCVFITPKSLQSDYEDCATEIQNQKISTGIRFLEDFDIKLPVLFCGPRM